MYFYLVNVLFWFFPRHMMTVFVDWWVKKSILSVQNQIHNSVQQLKGSESTVYIGILVLHVLLIQSFFFLFPLVVVRGADTTVLVGFLSWMSKVLCSLCYDYCYDHWRRDQLNVWVQHILGELSHTFHKVNKVHTSVTPPCSFQASVYLCVTLFILRIIHFWLLIRDKAHNDTS